MGPCSRCSSCLKRIENHVNHDAVPTIVMRNARKIAAPTSPCTTRPATINVDRVMTPMSAAR